ncbi:MAG: hypothetical protein JRI46_10770 [Deltaproteobacteria bacterium]|nr:hypothetical protein [Deltaproteobacteria bacterium]
MKRCLGGLVIVLVVLVAGVALAQMPAGPYNILHQEGAIYNSDTGWNLSTPPYYPGTAWAVDFIYNSEGVSILHTDGAIWNTTTGWNIATPPYYAGTGYAKALEYLRDLTGCWCLNLMEFEFWESPPGDPFQGEFYAEEYPELALEITDQIGTRLYGTLYRWDYDDRTHEWELEEQSLEGTVLGDFVYLAYHVSGAEEEYGGTFDGVIFWNEVEEYWEIKGSLIGTGMDTEENWGMFANTMAWKGTGCECPPPQPPGP